MLTCSLNFAHKSLFNNLHPYGKVLSMEKDINWHFLETNSALTYLDTSSQDGLSLVRAQERLAHYGINELIERRGRFPLQILWEHASAPMVLILLASAVIAGFLGEYRNTILILITFTIYVLIGFAQEYRAEKTVAALKKTSTLNVRVLRDAESKEVPARELVPGDIVQLETGNLIPADLRLLESVNLRIQEAILTGESEPIEKHTAALSGDNLPLRDRRNMAFMGTIVTQGRGLAMVIATGMQTELGKIADLIQQVQQEQTPLKRRLNRLGKNLAGSALGISALLFIFSILQNDDLHYALLAAVNVAVAIVPASLPVVITITLAFGAQRMFEREALIRKLPAADTLGSVTVICSDKTGTLTENKMTVAVLDVGDHALNLTEEMERGGSIRATRGLGSPAQSSLSLAAIGGALCNDAQLLDIGDDRYHTIGDPTEGALVVAAAKMGYWKSSLDLSFPRAAELPFDSERKRMTTVHHLGQYDPDALAGLEIGDRRYIAFSTGSIDGLLDVASHIWMNGNAQALDADSRSRIEAVNARLIKKGMRVRGVAFRLLDTIPEIIQTDLEQNLTFVGLFGMIDPPRKEVKDAIVACLAAGIRPVMITSDHPMTAIEIARQLGIAENGRALRGSEIESLSFDELKNVIDDVDIFARVMPEHKMKIVQALQAKGHIVAMTGDSVNDAPALRRADVGVAMGITGADVSKEAADMVLLDDSFATIVAAIKEARTISDNIRRFVNFSVAGNIGKVLVMLFALFAGKSTSLFIVQLLWLNFITDGLLGLGIGVEGPERGVMKHKPSSVNENIFGRHVIWLGVLIGILALGLGWWYYAPNRSEWQTMIFTSLAFMQVFHALALHSTKDILSNPLLTGMALLVVVLQMMVMYIPALANFFNILPLKWYDLFVAISLGLVVFAVIRKEKRV